MALAVSTSHPNRDSIANQLQTINVSIPVGSAVNYDVPSLKLPVSAHQIQVDLEDGDHLFTSRDFELGSVCIPDCVPLLARLTFKYSYDMKNKIVSVCGTKYPSADGMTMMTWPDGMDKEKEACFEHAAAAGFLADEVYRGGNWNYYSPLMPGAAERIKAIVQGANDALIAALGEVPDLTVHVRELLPDLPPEDFQALCFVAHGTRFEPYDPTRVYGDVDVLFTPFSVYDGNEQWSANSNFANVIGSTHDPKPPGTTSWIQLWRASLGRTGPNCTSRGFPAGITCSGTTVGGHIISGQRAQQVAQGSNNVRLFPICRGHNGRDNTHMQTRDERWAVRLRNYMGR